MSGFRRRRAPLLACGAVALISGVWIGLLRLGWPLPYWRYEALDAHGPLMISGFLGTVIALERAVAVAGRVAWVSAGITAIGAAALAAAGPGPLPAALLLTGSAGLTTVSLGLVRRHPSLHAGSMALGAVAWLVGNALWAAGWPFLRLVGWWAGFLVLTVAGERLELNRLLRPSPASRSAFAGVVLVLVTGLGIATLRPDLGWRLAGLGLLGLALWLLRYDVARRTVRQPGLPRFAAVCLLSGYAWLGVAGAIALTHRDLSQGLEYDAMLHALFLGFVFAMIFGHAPIVFPAVLGVPVPFRRLFYLHLGVLHVSVALRLAADLGGVWWLRPWSGLLSAAALALFVLATAGSVLRGSAQRRAA